MTKHHKILLPIVTKKVTDISEYSVLFSVSVEIVMYARSDLLSIVWTLLPFRHLILQLL